MTAALTLADQGFETTLVEKSETLGGEALHLSFNARGEDIGSFVKDLTTEVIDHPDITVLTSAEVQETKGHVGKFASLIKTNESIHEVFHGATIVATGGVEYKPEEYLYGEHENVMTQREFHGLLGSNDNKLSDYKNIAMIQCVGSRNEEHPYCSRICCTNAVVNALKFKELSPTSNIYILYRDLRTFGLNELYYKQAREAGIRFILYDPEQKPEVLTNGEGLMVGVFDQSMRTELKIPIDALILSVAIRPPAGKQASCNYLEIAPGRGRLLSRSACQAQAARFCQHRLLFMRTWTRPQVFRGVHCSGKGSGGQSRYNPVQKENVGRRPSRRGGSSEMCCMSDVRPNLSLWRSQGCGRRIYSDRSG